MIAWMQNPPRRANPKGVWRFDKKVHHITFCPADLDAQLHGMSTQTLKGDAGVGRSTSGLSIHSFAESGQYEIPGEARLAGEPGVSRSSSDV